jgi:hypothetical protein
MGEVLTINGLSIRPEFTESEVNFVVFNREGYLFRLVPDLTGFHLSPLDQALDAGVNLTLVEQIGDGIDNYYS